jgi:HPt (histidine-containing phosphotransfer) domain-containing protein
MSESLATEVAALAAEAKRLEDQLAMYTDAFARAQRTLIDAGNVLRAMRDGRAPGQSVNALIDECSLAAMNPGVVAFDAVG